MRLPLVNDVKSDGLDESAAIRGRAGSEGGVVKMSHSGRVGRIEGGPRC